MVAGPVEECLVEAVLPRLDTSELTDALAGQSPASDRADHLTSELIDDQAHLTELTEAYAAKQTSMAEWLTAKGPNEVRIQAAQR